MPTWGELLQELAKLQGNAAQQAQALGPPTPGTPSPHDILRRKYLKRLSERTGRATIVYATAWQENKPNVTSADVSVHIGDVQGFMEAVSNVSEHELDLFLHSPGGFPEAADSIMKYLRTRFDHIRAVVPLAAMSAATMMALACDEVVMGAHSQLGPIDPQLTISTPEGPRSAPAQAIIDQFERAKRECQNPANIAAWLPILRSYAPGLLASCDNGRVLAEQLVSESLGRYMFAADTDAAAKAEAAAKWFADFTEFRSHGLRVGRDDARQQKIKVIDLEADDELQDAMLSVHHAFNHTLAGTGAFKIIENHHGRAFVQQKAIGQIVLEGPRQAEGAPGATPGPQRPKPPPPPPRKQRKRR
jgi:Serine dehydrogenase proteinase